MTDDCPTLLGFRAYWLATNSGGMDKRCDRCSRCTDLDKYNCMMCSCSVKDGSYKHWSVKDLGTYHHPSTRFSKLQCRHPFCGMDTNARKQTTDDDLRVDWANDRICCGEWWGGPYCGFRGKPDKPAVSGQINYAPTLWP